MQKIKKLSLILACGVLISLPFCSFAAEVIKAELLTPGASAAEFVRPSDGARIKLATKAPEINRRAGGIPAYFFQAYDLTTGGLFVGDTGSAIVVPARLEVFYTLQNDTRLAKFREALELTTVDILYPDARTGQAKAEAGIRISKGSAAETLGGVVTLPLERTSFGFGTKAALDEYVAEEPALEEIWQWDANGDVRLDFGKATLLSKE